MPKAEAAKELSKTYDNVEWVRKCEAKDVPGIINRYIELDFDNSPALYLFMAEKDLNDYYVIVDPTTCDVIAATQIN